MDTYRKPRSYIPCMKPSFIVDYWPGPLWIFKVTFEDIDSLDAYLAYIL